MGDLDDFLRAACDLDTGCPAAVFDVETAHAKLAKRPQKSKPAQRDPDEIERSLRERMMNTLDDREVIFQVDFARRTGMVLCIMGGSPPRAPGPATLEVHEAEERHHAERLAMLEPGYVSPFRGLVRSMASLARSREGVPVPNSTTISVGVEANCPRPGR